MRLRAELEKGGRARESPAREQPQSSELAPPTSTAPPTGTAGWREVDIVDHFKCLAVECGDGGGVARGVRVGGHEREGMSDYRLWRRVIYRRGSRCSGRLVPWRNNRRDGDIVFHGGLHGSRARLARGQFRQLFDCAGPIGL